MKYNTRFAPSPTGMLHVGGVRTAIFCYLAAKATGGTFSLRIEDTDRERFVPGAVDAIHQGLNWLGIKNDGEVVYQSERVQKYQEYANKLIAEGKAYKCFCTAERLAELKASQELAKKPPVYDRCCMSLSQEEIAKKEADGEKFVIRFKIPTEPTEVRWVDKVRDEVRFATETLEDFIIIKSDGWPTYNFANVVDDHEQGFNLVIRGDEFVPSTPKHILLYLALGWEHPEFAHVPVIVGADMKKLSKRNGDTAITEYIDKGYLPEALINFLVFLGWNPGTTEEIFSLTELERAFSVDRIGKAPAVFDVERLNYLNGVYIRNLTPSELASKLRLFNNDFKTIDANLFEKVVTIEQTRIKTLAEFAEIAAPYWNLPSYPSSTLVFKKSSPEATKKGLEAFWQQANKLDSASWSSKTVEDWNGLLSATVANNQLSNADVFWPVRVALSGSERSASPAELLWALGLDSRVRLEKAIKSLG